MRLNASRMNKNSDKYMITTKVVNKTIKTSSLDKNILEIMIMTSVYYRVLVR